LLNPRVYTVYSPRLTAKINLFLDNIMVILNKNKYLYSSGLFWRGWGKNIFPYINFVLKHTVDVENHFIEMTFLISSFNLFLYNYNKKRSLTQDSRKF